MEILKIENLKKRFGDKEVLRGVNLTVPENCVFGFIGQNGAGKTTTMKTVLGLLKPDKGEIRVAGEAVAYGQTATNRMIGYLPDVPEFYGFLTASEYLSLVGECLSMKRTDIRERSLELLSLVGLSDEKHRIKGFSRGMKQRLGIAQALLGRPKLLICDEPTSALDPIGRKEILDILLSVKQETTVLFSTHILSDVERICTEVAFLHDGKIAVSGTVDSIKKMHRNEAFTLTLLHSEDIPTVLAAFPHATLTAPETLCFSGDTDTISNLLTWLGTNRIAVSRIERNEPSLESLFMEVIRA